MSEPNVIQNPNVHRPDLIGGYNRTKAIEAYALTWCQGRGVDYGYGDGAVWPGEVEGILAGAEGIDIGVWKSPDGDVERNPKYSDRCFPDWCEDLDYIFSSHALEHIADWKVTLEYWKRQLRRGGIVFLYLPHQNVGEWLPSAYAEHKWSPTWELVTAALTDLGFEILEYAVGSDSEGSFYVIARKP